MVSHNYLVTFVGLLNQSAQKLANRKIISNLALKLDAVT